MKVRTIKTHKITGQDNDIFKVLDKHIPSLKEESVLAITSKIIAICQGRIVRIDEADKKQLIVQESEYYLPWEENKYNYTLTIANKLLIPAAGIDESNGNGYFVLWPDNLQQEANRIRKYLQTKFSIEKIGVIITDSKTTPLRRGVTGVAIAHSGFAPLNNYIGKKDIFGRELHITKVNVMDGLAAVVVLLMGEGKEQTPLAVIEDLNFVKFQNRNPKRSELEELKIEIEDDLYGMILSAVKWKKGGGNKI